jgi:hypothetical protein
LICANLISHILLQGLRPPEIPNFDTKICIEKDIKALQIAVEDGRSTLVQIEHPLSNFNRQPPPLLPSNIVVLILQIRPERPSLAILQYETVVRIRGYSLSK